MLAEGKVCCLGQAVMLVGDLDADSVFNSSKCVFAASHVPFYMAV